MTSRTFLAGLHSLRPLGWNLSDGQLLEALARRQDGDAAAALLRRHGAMVWGVCRRLLPCPQDAEDAFQATFLALVRRAPATLAAGSLGPWLHGVACRTALKARTQAARRAARATPLTAALEPAAPSRQEDPETLLALDQEVNRLPTRYRQAFVLCAIQGLTRTAAARALDCPEGTVAGRLMRARTMLARRLRRRGIALAGAGLLIGGRTAEAAPPGAVLAGTQATLTAASSAAPAAAQLAGAVCGGLRMECLSAWASAAAAAVAAVGLGLGLWPFVGDGEPRRPRQALLAPAVAPAPSPRPEPPRRGLAFGIGFDLRAAKALGLTTAEEGLVVLAGRLAADGSFEPRVLHLSAQEREGLRAKRAADAGAAAGALGVTTTTFTVTSSERRPPALR